MELHVSFAPDTGTEIGCTHDLNEEDMVQRIDAIMEGYKGVRGSLIPILQSAQNLFGYLPEVVLKRISRSLNIPYS